AAEFLSVLLRLVQVYRESQTGSGLRLVQVYRESQTGSGLRLVQVYRESQAGSGLRLVQVSDWFRSQTGSGLRLVQVYRELLLMKMMMKMLVLVLVLVLVLSGVSADCKFLSHFKLLMLQTGNILFTEQQTNKQTNRVSVFSSVLHEDFAIVGCSDSDGEEMYSLDGEELWYADFKQGKGVEPQPSFIDHMSYVEGTYQGAVANQQICKQNLKNTRKDLKDVPLEKDAPSSLIVYSRDNVELGQANKLICHVSGFYPAPVQIVWKKNEKNVTEGTSFNVPFPNKDGSFSQFSSLEFSPEQGDVYSCSVTHLTLTQAMTRFWTVEKTEPGIGPAVFCGLGL
ncbi:hypothetical protein L3Q82_016380, partial [Scortum barcoo]